MVAGSRARRRSLHTRALFSDVGKSREQVGNTSGNGPKKRPSVDLRFRTVWSAIRNLPADGTDYPRLVGLSFTDSGRTGTSCTRTVQIRLERMK